METSACAGSTEPVAAPGGSGTSSGRRKVAKPLKRQDLELGGRVNFPACVAGQTLAALLAILLLEPLSIGMRQLRTAGLN